MNEKSTLARREDLRAFHPGRIGGLVIRNRLVRSATFESRAEKGKVTDELSNFYRTLTRGGVGLIITCLHKVENEIELLSIFTLVSRAAVASFSELSEAIHALYSRFI